MDDLFEFAAKGMRAQAEVSKLCHTNDPQTSFDAAEEMIRSGKLTKQENDVYHRIIQFIAYFRNPNDFTAKEISAGSAIDYYTVQRRLSGLRNKGKIERTGEKREGCCVWRLV